MNEKKLGAIIVLLIASIAPAMILTAYAENGFPPACTIMPRESIAIKNQCVNEGSASLNGSLSIFCSADKATEIKAVQLSDLVQSNFPGVAVCVNGTYIDSTVSPLFVIQPGNTATANMIIPYTNYPYALSTLHNAKVAGIKVLTDDAMYYVECSSSDGVSS